MAETKLKIKLVIDGTRVLYAEAGKDFVDFFCSILTLPVSTIIRLVGTQQMAGSLPNLYQSIQTLDHSYIRQSVTKDRILSPVPPLSGYSVPIFSLKEPPLKPVKCFYACSGKCNEFTDQFSASCSICRNTMVRGLTYVPSAVEVQRQESSRICGGGFVKECVTYMVMDDLGVQPMSTTSTITGLLKQFNVKDVFCAGGESGPFGNE